jgi:hypothetical protein
MIESDQLALIPAKLIELAFYLAVLFALNRRNKSTPFFKRNALHQFFLIGVLGWIIYIFLDSIIYVIAPLSLSEGLPAETVFFGYSEYPSLLWANILRDFGMLGGIIMALCYCAAAVKIFNGTNIFTTVFESTVRKALVFIFVIVVVLLDVVTVTYITPDAIHVSSGMGIQAIQNFPISSILIILIFSLSAFLMIRQLINIRRTDMEPEYKNRARKLGFGIITFTVGLYYWILTSVVFLFLPSLASFSLFFLYFGHAIWTFSAILLFLAFRKIPNKNNPE